MVEECKMFFTFSTFFVRQLDESYHKKEAVHLHEESLCNNEAKR